MYELPIFPLNTVLFPGMPLQLHIFEERYRVMIQHVLRTSRTFGVSLIKHGEEALGPLPEPHLTGCTARIVQAEPLEDGRFNLTVIGDERFRIRRMGVGQPYLTAFAESAPLEAHQTLEVVRGVPLLRDRLTRYLALLMQCANDEEKDLELDLDFDLTDLQLPDDPMMLIYLASALLQLPPGEKQPLLEANTATHLLDQLQRLLRRELAILPPLITMDREMANQSALMN
jgi:Lon protease-like protein